MSRCVYLCDWDLTNPCHAFFLLLTPQNVDILFVSRTPRYHLIASRKVLSCPLCVNCLSILFVSAFQDAQLNFVFLVAVGGECTSTLDFWLSIENLTTSACDSESEWNPCTIMYNTILNFKLINRIEIFVF